MNNEEKILQILGEMQKRLDTMDRRLDTMDHRMDAMDQKLDALQADVTELKEQQTETREGVENLIAWAEKVGNTLSFPLPRIGG